MFSFNVPSEMYTNRSVNAYDTENFRTMRLYSIDPIKQIHLLNYLHLLSFFSARVIELKVLKMYQILFITLKKYVTYALDQFRLRRNNFLFILCRLCRYAQVLFVKIK